MNGEAKCLCDIDHQKQQEMADAFKRLAEFSNRFAAELGEVMAQSAEQVVEMSKVFARLSEILTPEDKPPFDTNCVKCQESLFIGATPCDLHESPPPVVKPKKKKGKK